MMVQCLMPRLKQAGSQVKVINITSRVGSIQDNSSGGLIAYRTSKTALNMINKTLAIDIPDIPFLALHPGYISTGMVDFKGEMSPEEAVKRMIQVIDDFDLSKTGSFMHRDGYILPW
jgi:NAD(P)-dependent dehydrogenase (short-subunit alcohol dehydrogenase family)